MSRNKYPPLDEPLEQTRQLEMLMLGISIADSSSSTSEAPKPRRRTLDDMRRLSTHIKSVPVYTRK